MKTHFSRKLIAIGMTASFLPISLASAQNDADAAEQPAPAPSVPGTGTGGPNAVEMDPKVAQAEPTEKMGEVPQTDLTITEILAGAVDFTTLMGAVRAAGLEDSLKAAGPFTLLAPNNEAFEALPEGVLPMLMEPENVELLRTILTYHVIPKKVAAAELTPGNHVSSQGEPLTVVGGEEGEVTIQGAGFGTSDVAAKNGVIHVVKAVLLPPSVNIEDHVTAEEAAEAETETETDTEMEAE